MIKSLFSPKRFKIIVGKNTHRGFALVTNLMVKESEKRKSTSKEKQIL